jgi:RNA-directed DNA polymerase
VPHRGEHALACTSDQFNLRQLWKPPLKDKVSELLVPGNTGPWPEVRDRLNRLLRGWAAYFGYGTRLTAYRAVDNHVDASVRRFLVRRHKVPSRGTNRFPREAVFGALGVLQLRRVHLGPPPCA